MNRKNRVRRVIIDSMIVPLYGMVGRRIQGSSLAQRLRLSLFKRRPFLHKEFLVGRRDVVVLVGSPNPSNVAVCSRLVGGSGRVILIEADPLNASNQRKAAVSKGLNNVKVVAKACSSHTGTAELLVSVDPLDHKLVMDNIDIDLDHMDSDHFVDRLRVPVDTLDNIANECEINRIDYLEITVNGAEFDVLLGMPSMLKTTKRLFVKAHARDAETGRPISEPIMDLLQTAGFCTLKTMPSSSAKTIADWGARTGDVFAWRESNT